MPIYEYSCEECGAQFEVMQKVGSDAPDCQNCGSRKVKKMISATSFVLKGSGWYRDGYGSSKPEAKAAK